MSEKNWVFKRERELKKWVQPQLVVLVRSKVEEGVLSACKEASWSTRYISPNTGIWSCASTRPYCYDCSYCCSS